MSTSALSYDQHQFASRAYPVHAWQEGAEAEIHSNGIAFEDLVRMGCFVAKLASHRQLETPEWAYNDKKCRELIVAAIEERAYHRTDGTLQDRLAKAQELIRQRHCPRLVQVLDRLCDEYVSCKRETPQDIKRLRALEMLIENVDTQLRLYTKDGGAGVIAGVIHFYYRLGLNSVDTGREIGIKPPHVRQICWRLRRTWARLQSGRQLPIPKAGRPPKTCKPKPPKPPKPPSKKCRIIDVQEAARLLTQGLTLSEVGKQLGFTRTGVWLALRRAGLYTPKKYAKQPKPPKPKPLPTDGTYPTVCECGNALPPYDGVRRKYCSAACSRRAAKRRYRQKRTFPTVCARCGNAFPLYIRGRRRKYCSRACNNYAAYRRRKERLRLLRAQRPKPESTKARPMWPKVRPMTEVEKQNISFNPARVVELYRNGMTVLSHIAQQCGYPKKHGCNRVRRALENAGVYRRVAANN